MTDKIPEEFKKLSEKEAGEVKDTLRKSFDELSDEEKKSLAKNVAQILRDTLADGKLKSVLSQMVQNIQKKPDVFRRELEKKVK